MTKKKVNIYPRRPIINVVPPIRTAQVGVWKDIKDIRRCILSNARVEEVLSDAGDTISLNLSNYDIDNGADFAANRGKPVNANDELRINYGAAIGTVSPSELVQATVEEPKVEEEKKEEAPVEVQQEVVETPSKEESAPVDDIEAKRADIKNAVNQLRGNKKKHKNTVKTESLQ